MKRKNNRTRALANETRASGESGASDVSDERPPTAAPFPGFLIGFLLMSVLGSYVLGPVIPFPASLSEGAAALTTWLLTAAMVGLGLNVNLRDLRARALRPLLVMAIVSVLLSALAFGMAR